MSILLAICLGLGLAKLFMLPGLLGVILALYIYSKQNPKTQFFYWESRYNNQNTQIATYHHHLFLLMGYLAKADGIVSKAEIQTAENIMAELGLNYAQKNLAKNSFKTGSQGLNLANTIAYLNLLKYTQPGLLSAFFRYQERLIHADKHSRMNQINILNQIKFRLYQDQEEHHRTQPIPKNTLTEAYKTLGIHSKMSYPEMKRAYQRIVGKHHPDRARTEADRIKSEAYIKTVQNAWQVVKKHHKEPIS